MHKTNSENIPHQLNFELSIKLVKRGEKNMRKCLCG